MSIDMQLVVLYKVWKKSSVYIVSSPPPLIIFTVEPSTFVIHDTKENTNAPVATDAEWSDLKRNPSKVGPRFHQAWIPYCGATKYNNLFCVFFSKIEYFTHKLKPKTKQEQKQTQTQNIIMYTRDHDGWQPSSLPVKATLTASGILKIISQFPTFSLLNIWWKGWR